MNISAVNNYPFRTKYAMPKFEKNEKHYNNSIPNTLKAVPLVALLALSPLTKAQAQDLPKTISIEWLFGNPNEKVLYQKTFKNAYSPVIGDFYDNNAITFSAISNDGDNSDFEIGKVELTKSDIKLKYKDEKTGKVINLTGKKTYTYTISKLKETESALPVPPYIEYDFSIIGSGGVKTEYKTPDGITHEEYEYEDDKEIHVSEEFYDAVSEMMKNKVEIEEITDESIDNKTRLLNMVEDIIND